MLKRALKDTFYWVAVLLFAVWIIASSEAFQNCVHNHKSDNRYQALHESTTVVVRLFRRAELSTYCAGSSMTQNQGALTLLATALIALFTFTLTRSTDKLWSEANKTGRDTAVSAGAITSVADSMTKNVEKLRETVEINRGIADTNREIAERQKTLGYAQLRAYVSAIIGNGAFQDRGNNIRFSGGVNLSNSGATPAYKVRQKIRAGILPVPLPGPNDFELWLPGDFGDEDLLPPHSSRAISSIVPDYIADQDVPVVKRGMGGFALYVWGIVIYEDEFQVSHETKFCHALTWLPPNPINGIEQIWGYYISGRNTMKQLTGSER